MRCTDCGTELPQEASFCYECGAKIDRESVSFQRQDYDVASDYKLIIVTISLGIIAACSLFYFGYVNIIFSSSFGIILQVLAGVMLIYSFVIALIYIFGLWDMIPEKYARTTPVKAALFLLLPVYNLYWVFQVIYGFAFDYNRFLKDNYPESKALPDKIFFALSLALVILPFSVFLPSVFFVMLLTCWLMFIFIIYITAKSANEIREDKKTIFASLKSRFGMYITAFTAVLLLVNIVVIFLPRPFFVVSDFGVRQEFVEGDRIVITATLENKGTAPGKYPLTLYLNGEEIEAKTVTVNARRTEKVNYILPGNYKPGQYSISLGVGMYSTRLIDLYDTIRVLRAANLVIEDVELNPREINYTEKTEVRVSVKNTGEVEGSKRLQLSINDKLEDFKTLQLYGESSRTATFTLDIDEPGLHTISVNDNNVDLQVFQIERPENGKMFVREAGGGYGQLRINNENSDLDIVVIMVDPADIFTPLMAAYVQADSRYTISSIRDGNYYIYYSEGKDWCKHAHKFTNNARHGRFEEVTGYETTYSSEYYYYDIWEADFGIIETGEVTPSVNVAPEDFPPLM